MNSWGCFFYLRRHSRLPSTVCGSEKTALARCYAATARSTRGTAVCAGQVSLGTGEGRPCSTEQASGLKVGGMIRSFLPLRFFIPVPTEKSVPRCRSRWSQTIKKKNGSGGQRGEHFISQDFRDRLLKNVKCEIFLSYRYFWIHVSFPSMQVHDANTVAVAEK